MYQYIGLTLADIAFDQKGWFDLAKKVESGMQVTFTKYINQKV